MNEISLKEAIDIIKKVDAQGRKVPFSIDFVTYDEQRPNKPSKHMRFERSEECGANHDLVRHRQIGVRPLDRTYPPQVAVHLSLIMKVNDQFIAA